MSVAFDPWATTSGGSTATRDRTYPKSLVDRAKRRISSVRRVSGRKWVVEQDSKLGDVSSHEVELGADESYGCSCFEESHGESRRARGCSHVLAVTLAREEIRGQRRSHDEEVSEPPSVAESTRPVLPSPMSEAVLRPAEARDDVPGVDDPMWTRRDGEPLPAKFDEIRGEQWDAVQEVRECYARGEKVVWLDGPTGCIGGETELTLNRAGRGFRMSMLDLYEKFHGRCDNGRSWDPNIPTYVAQGDMEQGIVRSSLIETVVFSGLKPTLQIRISDGRTLYVTDMHRIMTPTGWRPAADLVEGDEVLVNVGHRKRTGPSSKLQYPTVCGLKGHPRATMPYSAPGGGWKVPRHILVVEADMNGLDYPTYIRALRAGETDFKFVSRSDHVHHIDGNTLNFELGNLEVLTAQAHHQHHADVTRVAAQLGFRSIKSIIDGGSRLTFDITMAEGGPHFIAGGIYVHNSGKTLIGEMVRRLEADRAFYICHSKTLQEQMVADFHYARVLKGRSNYPTLNGPRDATCGDCTASGKDDDCLWCSDRGECPYEVAKIDAIRAKLAVVNTAYFLNEWNYVGRVGRERELGIIDECDTLEGELMGFVEFRVGERLLSAAGVDAPKEGSHRTTIRKWLEDELQPALKDLRAGIRGEDLRAIRDRQRVNRVIADLTRVVARESDDEGLDGWVRDNRAGPMVLKPVVVDEWGQKNVWRHSEKWLCMSATIISPDELARSNGIEDGKWGLVQVPMTFPVENRQVIVAPVADMGRKGRDAGEWEYAVRAVERICERHPGDRVLVHTVSYDLAKYLKERVNLRRKVIIYTEGSRRDAALEEFRRSKAGVLLAASMDRGVDLAGDECRVVIVAKVPFPNLGDRQVGERMRVEGGGVWYSVQAVRKLVQMTGRAVRSRDDWAVSYVIDRQFVSNVWKKSRGLLPKWWVEALVWDFPVRELMTP